MIGTKRYPEPASFAEMVERPSHEFKSLFGRQSVKGLKDIMQIEAFLRVVKPATIVELGTGEGMHTAYLALYAALNGAQVISVDASNEMDLIAPLADHLPLELVQADILKTDVVDKILARDLPGPLMLYCDNGDKPREVQRLVPQLAPGDYCIVHDWGLNIQEADVAELLMDDTITYYHRLAWEHSGTHMGFVRT